MLDVFKILVLSDLHCTYKPKNEEVETRLYSNLLRLPQNHHPIEALKSRLKEDKIDADIVICPGDITDKSNDQGFISGFEFLTEISRFLGNKELICTLGNHDIDSRGKYSDVVDKIPKGISTKFPFQNETLNSNFWAKHFALKIEDNYAILVFNSAFSHTNETNAQKSIIESAILEQIQQAVRSIPDSVEYRLALSHHHPMKHSNMHFPDSDVMDKGDDLLKILSIAGFDLFVHGHKHEPRLNYFNSLPILASGSFSSFWNTKELGAENVFHYINLYKNGKGNIRSYVYGPNAGWYTKHDAYFPCFTGFGFKGDLDELGDKILKSLGGKSLATFDSILQEFPEVSYLIPEDQRKLNKIIKDHGYGFEPELPNKPGLLTKIMSQ